MTLCPRKKKWAEAELEERVSGEMGTQKGGRRVHFHSAKCLLPKKRDDGSIFSMCKNV